jgi:hypothetical protein
VAQPTIRDQVSASFPEHAGKVLYYPRIHFEAFHPDIAYVYHGTELVCTPMHHYNSKLVLLGYLRGLDIADTINLFADPIYERAGFLSLWDLSRRALLAEGETAGFPLKELFADWSRKGCFMHSINHPRLLVLAGIARDLLLRLNLPVRSARPEDYLPDNLAQSSVWPVYPEIATRLGLQGDHAFKIPGGTQSISLREFVEASFATYSKFPTDGFISPFLTSKQYHELCSYLDASSKAALVVKNGVSKPRESNRTEVGAPAAHPYHGLPDCQFWRKSVESVPFSLMDPVVKSRLIINKSTRIVSAGSCFAQHITRELQGKGFNYFVTESAPANTPSEVARQRSFGVFSARYGNIYTARQLSQLIKRAYSEFVPVDNAWESKSGYADPFRPTIEPSGFQSIEELEASRELHLAAVRQMFESLDVFIFTLGLTEAWCSRQDGAAFPLAPGVAAGKMDWRKYRFVNLSFAEVVEDLTFVLERLRQLNEKARVILTVSPVPLVATYEDQHVLVSNTYSKAVLRAAAGEIARRHEVVEYFPAYEIIAGHYNRGAYFDADARSVTSAGVEHVMRVFLKHYTGVEEQAEGVYSQSEIARMFDIICDEEQLDRVVT